MLWIFVNIAKITYSIENETDAKKAFFSKTPTVLNEI